MMRSQESARRAAALSMAETIDALQDANAPEHIIDKAEKLQSNVVSAFET